MKKIPLIIYILTILLLSGGCKTWSRSRFLGLGGHNKLRLAEELSRQGKLDEAISTYRQHMEERLSVKDRPEWENPFFYYLLIGDIELGRGMVDKALEAYNTARQKGIHTSLISDRYRFVASWYESHKQFDQAISLLKEHCDLDPLLFYAMLDRIAKYLTHIEDTSSSTKIDLSDKKR